MGTQLEPHRNSAPLPELTAADLEELQLECAAIAAFGGEVGAIAAEIARISRALGSLCAKADEFLESPTVS